MKNPPTISHEFPPNIDTIRDHFPLTGNEIFAYDGVIYHPGSGHLTAPLIAHEQVHFRQQEEVGGAAQWWDLYIKNPEFRFDQELEAHREELRVFCKLTRRRDAQWKYAAQLGYRLASPVYGVGGKKGNGWEIAKQIRLGILG